MRRETGGLFDTKPYRGELAMDSNAIHNLFFRRLIFLYARCNLYSRGGAVQPFSLHDTFSGGGREGEEGRVEKLEGDLTEPSPCV